MAVFKKKNSPNYYYEFQGYIKQMSLHTSNKRKAMRLANELDEVVLRMKTGLLNNEEWNLARRIKDKTIKDIYDKYYKAELKNKKKPQYYTSKLLPFIRSYGQRQVKQFTFEDACAYREKLIAKYTPKTANNHLSEIKRMLQFAVNSKYAKENVMHISGFLPSTKPTRPRKPIRKEWVENAINLATCERDRIYWTILLHTGLRANDAGNLTPEKVSQGIFQQKTGEYRKIMMTPTLRTFGDAIYNVCPSKQNQRTSREAFQEIMYREYSYKTDLHSIRHTTFTMLVNNGFDQTQVGQILGTESSVGTYAETDFSRAEQVITNITADA